jgi:hypothetical protein
MGLVGLVGSKVGSKVSKGVSNLFSSFNLLL